MSLEDLMRKSTDWYVKWIASLSYIASAVCAAGAWLPYNYLLGVAGAVLWTIVGMMWHDRSLIVMNAFTAAMMTTAIINWLP